MNANLKIGSGSSSVAINKDISSNFALDVSGVTQIRGNLDVAGAFTVNGAPISGGGSLTGNVQVGTNSGFVTMNKPQFYSDPSLTIYYDFDSASYSGTTIANKGNGGSGLTATLQGTTTGMIDTGNFYLGTASLRNDTITSLNQGIKVNSSSIPIGTNMSFSFWLRKKNKPPGTDSDRIFEYSTNSTVGAVGENNSIALDISSSGIILPVLTGSGGNPVTSCFGTLSAPIISYNVCDDAWKHIIWSINGSLSTIYVNGSITQQDTITGTHPFAISSTRVSAMIGHSTVTSLGGRDFSGNIDDFRYYKDKALNYAEIYQLYNNNFYTLDICGGFLSNGSSVIYEPVGSVATANSGSLTLLHGDTGGSSSIMFKSNTGQGDYAYIEYDDALNQVQSILKYDLSSNTPSFIGTSSPVVYATLASTGTSSSVIGFGPHDNSFAWVSNTTALNGVTPAYCLSFNQTNLSSIDTTSRVNFLVNTFSPNFSSFTFSAWIRPGTITPVGGTAVRWIIANLNNSSNDGVIDIYLESSNGRIFVLFDDEEIINFIYTSTQLVVNTWYHLVFTFDGINKTGNIYINGILDTVAGGTGGTGLTGKTLKPNTNLVIGMKYGWNTGTGTNTVITSPANYIKGFRGQMVFLNVFDVPLNASEVSYLYNNPSYNPTATSDRGLLTIGIENETGYINSDRIALWPGAGNGFVGVNTRIPEYTLDVSGTLNTNSDAVINGFCFGRGAGNGISNIAVGYQALHSNTTGYQNIAIGFQALTNHKSGFDNIALGYQAVKNCTSGVSNIGLGSYALANCTTGGNNTGVGFGALLRVTTAFHNVGIGRYAGVGDTGSGYNFQGEYNTFLGSYTGMTGAFNNSTAVGSGAIITATNQIKLGTNSSTVICGSNLLLQGDGTVSYIRSTTGALYLGGGSISSNVLAITNGSPTSADQLQIFQFTDNKIYVKPYIHGLNLGAANQNILDISSTGITVSGMLKTTAAVDISGRILISEAGAGTTGSYSGGSLTLQHETNGASSIVFRSATNGTSDYGYIRYQDHVATTNFNGTNENGLLTIGIENDGASGGTADRIVLWACDAGTSAATGYVGINTKNPVYTLDVSGNVNATSYNASSDYRIKENVMPLDLQFNVDVLKPVSYVLKNDKDAKLQIGFIAHEVQEFYPFLVNGNKDGPNTQSINYNGFIGILTKEIQYLKKKVLDQEARLAEQEAKALEQNQRIQALEKMMLDLINK
jgi:hypothetical protein